MAGRVCKWNNDFICEGGRKLRVVCEWRNGFICGERYEKGTEWWATTMTVVFVMKGEDTEWKVSRTVCLGCVCPGQIALNSALSV